MAEETKEIAAQDEGTTTATTTKKQIEAWKKQYGQVHEISVPGNDEGDVIYKCYLKKPDRKIIAMASSVGSKDPIKTAELVLNNCWLGGDEIIKTDDDCFLAAVSVLGNLVKTREAEIVKL